MPVIRTRVHCVRCPRVRRIPPRRFFCENADFLVLDHAVDDTRHFGSGHVRCPGHEATVVLPDEEHFLERDGLACRVRPMVNGNRAPRFDPDLTSATLNDRVHLDTSFALNAKP